MALREVWQPSANASGADPANPPKENPAPGRRDELSDDDRRWLDTEIADAESLALTASDEGYSDGVWRQIGADHATRIKANDRARRLKAIREALNR